MAEPQAVPKHNRTTVLQLLYSALYNTGSAALQRSPTHQRDTSGTARVLADLVICGFERPGG